MTAAQIQVPTKGATTGIPEVDKMNRIRDFAAVFGATTLIKAQDWNGTDLEWIAVTPDSGKEKGRQIVMPLSMLMSAEYPEMLEGYFPIYTRGIRPLGKVASKATVTATRRPRKDLRQLAEEARKKRVAAIAAAAPQAAAGGATAGGGRGGAAPAGGGAAPGAGVAGPRAGRGRQG